jgi:hypothetical protein
MPCDHQANRSLTGEPRPARWIPPDQSITRLSRAFPGNPKREDHFVATIDTIEERSRSGYRRLFLGLVALCVPISLVTGCGYTVRAPFDTDIQTVFVPIAISNTYRREMNLQLTELVQNEIKHRSPYKVVGTYEEADTVLDLKINYAEKNLVVENPFNLPLELNATVTVMAKWTHNPPTEAEKKRAPTMIMETTNFIPQVGESTTTAFYQVNQRIAQQIVDMMEKPWYTDSDLK